MDKELKRSLVLLGVVTLVTAWFSELHYHPDEHYQTLEFMSWKLGITPVSELPWEFSSRIRPWLHPLLYFLIAKPLILLGVKDMFTIVFLLRLVTGLLSLVALAVFVRALLPTMEDEAEKRALVRYLPLFGFLPYLFVRTSSEAVSGAFFAIGLALTIGKTSGRRLALAGLALVGRIHAGLSGRFHGAGPVCLAGDHCGCGCRAGGVYRWGLCAVLLGALADRWGYGPGSCRLTTISTPILSRALPPRGSGASRCSLSLSDAGADFLCHHACPDGRDGGDVAAQSSPSAELDDLAFCAGPYGDRA
jgi:phosphatidylinositol glycan class B